MQCMITKREFFNETKEFDERHGLTFEYNPCLRTENGFPFIRISGHNLEPFFLEHCRPYQRFYWRSIDEIKFKYPQSWLFACKVFGPDIKEFMICSEYENKNNEQYTGGYQFVFKPITY